MFGNKWTSEYYDVMEFYYWEPQHLGKIKNPKSRYNNQFKSLEHIRNMEVSLNHMFNVFFRLTPSKFVSDLLSTTCNVVADSKLSMQGRYDVRKFSKMVQPDLLFVSDNINFSIEMKIGAKSSLEQVYKYALLHWLEQQHSGRKIPPGIYSPPRILQISRIFYSQSLSDYYRALEYGWHKSKISS